MNISTCDTERHYINNRALGLEIYVAGYKGRFVAVTGNTISGNGIEELSEAAIEVLERYMLRPAKAKFSVVLPLWEVISPLNPFWQKYPHPAKSNKNSWKAVKQSSRNSLLPQRNSG